MNLKRSVALLLAAVLCITPLTAASTARAAEPELTGFAAEFANPDNLNYKPHMRWWISPGAMNEEETRREVRLFAEKGFSGMELIAMGGSDRIHSDGWNEMVSWVLDEAIQCGVKIDFTLGEGWPIATYDIAREDIYTDPRTEKKLGVGETAFTATAENRTYSQTELQFPEPYYTSGCGGQQLNYIVNPDEYYELLAVTAAKKNEDGTYDSDTAVDLTALLDENGAFSWTAPSEGTWGIFHSYMQSTGKGNDYPVIDHMSKDAVKIITDAFDRDFAYELKDGRKLGDLYKAAGGCFFGDSFELSSVTLWTKDMLQEFKARRGYDLTPYLPTIFSRNSYTNALDAKEFEFDEIGAKVRMDYGRTVSELIAENHLQEFNDWADETVGMDLRYQVHSSKAALFMDQTVGSAAVDIPETESYALGNSLDQYRLKSGVVHMNNTLYTSETAAANNMSWRQSWTGTRNEAGDNRDLGFMRYTNRLFAAGVNKLYFHGTSYDSEGATFPGSAVMAFMDYPNEWDEQTPLWEGMDEMIPYLTRTQMVLQQGRGDIDLAYYRLLTTVTSGRGSSGDMQAAPREINKAGYNFDYVTESVLAMENAVVGTKDGAAVLAPDGPSYKALVLDLRPADGNPYAMTVETAERVLGFAEAGLPVAIVGKAPEMVAGLNGTEAELKAVVDKLMELAIFVPTGGELAAKLQEHGIYPDANPDTTGENMFYHRHDGDVDFYFAANDSYTDVCTQNVTFHGEGRPYLLNAWDGTVQPIAAYTAAEDGVTVQIELAPGEQMLLAVAPDGWCGMQTPAGVTATNADAVAYEDGKLVMHTTKRGDYTVELADGSVRSLYVPAAEDAIVPETWNLVVHQWMPVDLDDPTVDPYHHQIIDSKTYAVPGDDMKAWHQIDRENLLRSSGVGEYTTTFTLKKGWAEGQGAILSFTDVSDTMEVYVNGQRVTANQLNSTLDIGPALVAGENTIRILVSSTMGNYMYGGQSNSGMMGSATAEQNTSLYGILGKSCITPYVRTTVYDPERIVTVQLNGMDTATVDDEMLSYALTAENVSELATATLEFRVDGLAEPTVVPAEGWYCISQTAENGAVTAVLAHKSGVSSEAPVEIASLTGTIQGVGTVSVTMTDVTLSSFHGSGEAFDYVVLGRAAVETQVGYSVYDVNQDGKVDQLDITRAQRCYGMNEGDEGWNTLADVNGDHVVDINDLILILNNYTK